MSDRTMQAIVYNAYGGPDRLELVTVPLPTPVANQLLLRVKTASVNPVDWKVASGKIRLISPARFPQVPGYDVAGEVVGWGPGVQGFVEGELVHARLAKAVGAACAEYTVVGLDVAAKVPAGMDLGEAAGLPLAGMTALQGLRDRVNLPMVGARERVLIVGASGGVGHLAVQIARAAGATVVGVCSGKNAALVASLGAHEVVDYTTPNAFEAQAPFDAVLDCVGGSPGVWTRRLAPGGRFASCMPGPAVFLRQAVNAFSSRSVRAVMLRTNAADLQVLDRLVEGGMLRVVIDSRFPLRDMRGAWERSMQGRAVGKIIVDVSV